MDGLQSANRQFHSTRWSLVLEAAHRSSPDGRQALETLCTLYWYPLYAFVRRRGYGVHEAQDLTQEFFTRLLEKGTVEAADPSRGRFRNFLLASLRNFLANQWDKQQADKRGGGRRSIPLDFVQGDSRYASLSDGTLTPEQLYERQWAITLLDHVIARLRDEFVHAEKELQFNELKQFLAGRSESVSYADAARALGMTVSAAMTAASRLRKRYRALLREEIANTVADESEVDEEFRALFEILKS